MKKIIILLTTIASGFIYSQVGINTVNPQGAFHVDGLKDNPATGAPTAVQGSNDFTVTSTGSVGVGTTTPNASAILDVNVDGLATGSKKGLLGPKAALTSQTDQVTIPSPVAGLLVYNLGTRGLTYVGYVFWNGTEWRTLDGRSLVPGTISALDCVNATLSPGTYTSGTPYTGTLTVPYTGGNGGTYPAQTMTVNGLAASITAGNFAVGSGTLIYSVSGNPTLSSPNTTAFPLNIGGQNCTAVVGSGSVVAQGQIVYYKTGPMSALIDGGGNTGNVATGWLNFYQSDLPVLGGKLRLDGYFNGSATGSGSVSFNPRFVNISSSNVKFNFSALTTVNNYNTNNLVLAPKSWVNIDDGIYNGNGANSILSTPTNTNVTAIAPNGAGVSNVGQNNTEVVQVDLSLDGNWYRIYYYPIIDNLDTVSTTDDVRVVYISIQRLY